jgi:hypothetical protein
MGLEYKMTIFEVVVLVAWRAFDITVTKCLDLWEYM